jgi:formylglycine-generating enzyme required for sulfatase activity
LHPDSLPEGASAVGAVQLLGNLWEWTSTLQEKGRKKGLLRKATPDRYVLRGGSWDSEAPTLRARWVADADTQAANVGLRCVFREAPAP